MGNVRLAMMEKFIDEEWDLSMVLTPEDICKRFLWSNRISRYYSQIFVDRGVLCRIVIDGRIYYTKSDWYDILKKYSSLNDVKIT